MDEFDYYPFVKKPFSHQLSYLREHAEDEYHALFWEMGSGKSKGTIDNAAYLYDLGEIDALLIIALNGVHSNWPNVELPAHMPPHIEYNAFNWGGNRSTKAWKERWENLLAYPDFKILCINVEALSHPSGYDACIEFIRSCESVMGVVDESTTIKSHKSRRTKAVLKLSPLLKYRRILTGTPITESPFNAFSQAQFLKPGLLGYTNFFSFSHRYAEYRTRMLGPRQFQEVVRYKNLEELKGKLEQFSTFVAKADCLDLPPKLYTVREVPLSKQQQKLYKDMRELYMAELNDITIEVDNPLGKLQKLHQIICGHMIDGVSEQTITFDDTRMTALMDTIEECTGKVIIFAHFVHSIHRIMEQLAAEYGHDSCVHYYGGTSADDRARAIRDFQDPDSPVRFFVANQQTAGYGLTLTQARTVIYFSNSYSLEQRLQSEDRPHRPGQNHPVNIVDLIAPDTVDAKLRNALIDKVDVAQTVTGLLKGWLT